MRMRKKLFIKIICLTAAFICAFSFAAPSKPVRAAVTYTVDTANTDATFTALQSFATYEGAYQYFSSLTDRDSVLRDSDGRVYAMKEGMAITQSSDSTLIFSGKLDGGITAYCQNGYAAYYNSTDSGKNVTITISGYTGVCSVNSVILIPSAHMYPRCTSSDPSRYFLDYYTKNADGDLLHYLSTYSSSSGRMSASYITVDKAPSFMVAGEKYYSTDGFTYYTDPFNAVSGSNPAGTHLIYYKWLSYRSRTNYTEAELNSFLAYKNVNYRSQITCAYLGLGGTYLEAQSLYGVNAAMELAFANHESAYGKSNFAVDDNNFFGVGAFDSNPSLAASYTGAQIGILSHAKTYMNRGYLDAYAYINGSLGTAYYDVSDKTTGYISSYAGDSRYFGASPGNKAIGLCVKYASDAFHGEKVAARMYEIDKYLGSKDYGIYTIGLTNTNANAYSAPDASSWVLYKYTSKDPNRSAGNLSYGPTGMPVIILGETGDFYKIQSDMPVNADGYACNSWNYDYDLSVAYVLKSNIDIWFTAGDLDDVTDVEVELTSDVYSINRTGKTVTGVSAQTAISNFAAAFANGSVKLFENNAEVTEGYVKTGMTVKIYDSNGTLVTGYKAVVTGDINGDGSITTTDLVTLRRYLAGLVTLNQTNIKACDLNSDNAVSITDLVIMRRYLAGLASL